MKHLILCILLFFAPSAHSLSLNDLSVLLPLPRDLSERSLLLQPKDRGSFGDLIPMAIYKKLPQLLPESANSVPYRNSLRVIAIRIDPCFFEGVGPQACRHQIRLVWQPVVQDSTGVTTRDAAVHSFYEMNEVDFSRLWPQWRTLFSGLAADPLQVQPQLRKEGLHGPTWRALRDLVLKTCGAQNLVRVTTMALFSGEELWIFQGFDVVQGQVQEIKIPRIQETAQALVIGGPSFKAYTGIMAPSPEQDSQLASLVQNSFAFLKTRPEVEVKELMNRLYEYENPLKHNPGTLDCASCHVAQQALSWGQQNYSFWDWKNGFDKFSYKSTWNLEPSIPSVLKTNQLRAFGYFTNQPAISQRVINETAEAANWFSARQ